MTFSKQRILILALQSSLLLSLGKPVRESAAQGVTPSRAKLSEMVRKALDKDATIFDGIRAVFGDFNGDGRQDVAVAVNVEKDLTAMLARGMTILSLDKDIPNLPPLPRSGPEAVPYNCLGLLIVESVGTKSENDRLLYGCFSNVYLVPKTEVHSGFRGTAALKGDALRLNMETGAVLLLYNDGKSYHGYLESMAGPPDFPEPATVHH